LLVGLQKRPKLTPLWAFTNYWDFPISRIVELASSVLRIERGTPASHLDVLFDLSHDQLCEESFTTAGQPSEGLIGVLSSEIDKESFPMELIVTETTLPRSLASLPSRGELS
jgi:hypothetical protein